MRTPARTLPRVVLVDDHSLFRSGVRAEIGDRVEVVGEADDVGLVGDRGDRPAPPRRGAARRPPARRRRPGGHHRGQEGAPRGAFSRFALVEDIGRAQFRELSDVDDPDRPFNALGASGLAQRRDQDGDPHPVSSHLDLLSRGPDGDAGPLCGTALARSPGIPSSPRPLVPRS